MKPYIYDLDYVKEKSKEGLFNVVSLFAGCGGSSTGYRLAGGDILAVNEFVPEAQKVYAKNYPDTHIFKEDIRELTGEDILKQIGLKVGELDILDGSPPCASFSGLKAMTKKNRVDGWGVSKNYSDTTQRTDDLFFEFARVLKEVQPKVFIAENVKGITTGASKELLGSDQLGLFGAHEDTIYHSLVNCGYRVKYKTLNAKNYRVPQARERVIFIGVRNDISKSITFPDNKAEVVTVGEVVEWIDSKVIEVDNDYLELSPERARVYDLQLAGESMRECGIRLDEKISGVARRKVDATKPCNTVTVRAELWHPTKKRGLSIGELKIICSFPYDYYTGEKFNKKHERLGRAVPPLMMGAIAKHVYNTILK